MKQIHKKHFRHWCNTAKSLRVAKVAIHVISDFRLPAERYSGDFDCVNGWKLQKNSLFGNCRILDPDDERQALGVTKEQLKSCGNDYSTYLLPIEIIAGASKEKVSFENTGLFDSLPFQRITMQGNHPGLRDSTNTGKFIQKFFDTRHSVNKLRYVKSAAIVLAGAYIPSGVLDAARN